MSAAAFSSDGDSAMLAHKELARSAQQPLSDEDVRLVYETERCIEWIKTNSLKMVALQLPDDLLKDSTALVRILKSAVDAECVVLADTSYGSCCVDEVAAKHYSCDAIIHYGPSCLSPTSHLPVLLVFCQLPIDVDDCCSKCASLIDNSCKLIVLYEVAYHYKRDQLVSSLESIFPHARIPTIEPSKCGLSKFGRNIILNDSEKLDDYSILYIGEESLFFNNCVYTMNKCTFYSYNPVTREARLESMNVNKMLMKRYFMVEKAKDADIIGILVGTLGVANYLQVISRLKKLIRSSGKKSYTFVVGKLNVAKLANFAHIDVFVFVACPENSLLDSKDFYRPVITPYEMEIALNPDREWTGDYVVDFQDLLPGGASHVNLPDGPIQMTTDISLVSGKLRCLGIDQQMDETGAVVERTSNMTVANTAATFLAQSSWQGLDPQLGQTPVQKAVEGAKGIAMGYSHEPST